MKIETHIYNNTKIAELISDSLIISNIEDGTNLLGDLYFQGFNRVFIHKSNITPEFFDLKTGIAGEILQKFSTYRVRLAIIGDFATSQSKSLKDFILESNKIGHINFVESESEAINQLLRR